MKINIENLINNKAFFEKNNIEIPKYDIKQIKKIQMKNLLGFISERVIYSEVLLRE